VLVAIGGLPGSGKSTLARALAPSLGAAPGALILRSDEIRKRRHAAAPEQRLPASAYAESESRAVMADLAAAAAAALAAGHAVIADATFMDPADRAAIAAAAGRASFAGAWLHAPFDVLEARVAARAGDASDADAGVLRRAAGALRSLPDPAADGWLPVDALSEDSALAALGARLS
jgi:predicted kinase